VNLPTLALPLMTLASQPAAATGDGVSHRVADAFASGDIQTLEQITGGIVFSKLTREARMSVEPTRLELNDLVSELHGCSVSLVKEADENISSSDRRGSVGFTCKGRQLKGNGCYDVGYGLFLLPLNTHFGVEVWENNRWSKERCGEMPPPPSPAPPASVRR